MEPGPRTAAETVTAYRIGERYELETEDAAAQPVKLALARGVWIGRSGKGWLLLYRGHEYSFGMRVDTAMQLGWCWLLEEEGAPPRDADPAADDAASDPEREGELTP